MTFLEMAEKRFSVRKYQDRPIEAEKLDRVLAAVRLAPTAKNLQPWRVYVLKSAESHAKLDALTPMRYGAPVVLLFTYRTDEQWQNPFQPEITAGVQDASIAATHAMFEADELGLGSCWCAYFPNAKVEAAFGLDANEKSVLLLPIGYPAADAAPSDNHAKRRPLAELVKEL